MTTNIPLRIYVAGPFTEGHTASPEKKAANIAAADSIARALYLKGHWPFCPHTMSARWDSDLDPAFHDYERIVKGLDFAWLRVCDAVFLVDGWQCSRGARLEYDEAYLKQGLDVFTKLEDVPEVVSPTMTLCGFDEDFRKARRAEREAWHE